MKTFEKDGNETPSLQSWELRYYELKSKYETLEKIYNELRTEMSWSTNPDRSGGQFSSWDRGNDGWEREYPDTSGDYRRGP